MKRLRTIVSILFIAIMILAVMMPGLGFAETGDAEQAAMSSVSAKTIAAAIAIGLAAGCGAIAMGLATGKTNEAISRQPEAESKIRSSFMLGLVFIETAIIYALLVVILIVFVM